MGFSGKRKTAGKKRVGGTPRGSKKTALSIVVKKPVASAKKWKDKGLFTAIPFFNAFFENNPAIKLLIEAHTGRIAAANSAACSFYGYAPEKFESLSLDDLNIMPRKVILSTMARSRVEKKRHIRVTHRIKDGTLKRLEVFSNLIRLNGHDYFLSVIHDITALSETKSKLLRSEKQYRTVLENAADAMFMHDNKGAILDVSQQTCTALGYSREELLGMTIFDVKDTSDKAALIDAWNSMKEDEPRIFHGSHKRKNGGTFPVEVSVRMFTNRNRRLFIAIARDISIRYGMEKELSRVREMLQAVMDNTLTHIWVKDVMGCYLMVNRQWEKEINLPFHKVKGKTDYDIFSNDVAEELRANDQLVIKARRPITTEETVEMNGERRFFITVKFPLLDASGAIYAVGGVGTDITGIKKAEDALRESEAKYSAIMHGAYDAIFLVDTKGDFVDANQQGLRLLGYSREELMKLNIRQMHPPEQLEQAMESFNAMLQKGYSGRAEAALMRKNGDRVPVDVTGSLIEYGGRKLALGIFRDMTERKRADLRMRLLQNAMEQADETVIITNANGLIEYANTAAEKKSGYPLRQLLGKNPRIFKSGLHDVAFYERLWRTIKSGHTWRGNIINQRADGSHYEEEVTISPVQETDGTITHFVAIRRDINEQKHLRQQLIHAEKLSSIGTFVAGVAHELNNPLTAVIGFSNDLRHRADLPEDLRPILDIIADQSKRAVGVVKNLLSYSRPHKPEWRTQDINKLMENTIGIHRYRLQADGIIVKMTLATDPLPVHVDAGHIQQVVVNILLNAQAAIKSSGVGGVISVTTGKAHEWVEDVAVITISNSGPPIPGKDIDRIFDPYFTTKGAGEGTGLGLYIAYSIIKDHQGTLTVENLPNGSGVAFHITLPISAKEDQAVPTPVIRGGTIPPGTKVLVVDDEAMVREWLTGMLLRNKVFAAAAGSVREAVEYVQNGSFDVVVSDYKMPEQDGIILYQWLEQEQPELAKRFMFLTGAVENRLMEFCVREGLTALLKPVDEEAIIATIAQLLIPKG